MKKTDRLPHQPCTYRVYGSAQGETIYFMDEQGALHEVDEGRTYRDGLVLASSHRAEELQLLLQLRISGYEVGKIAGREQAYKSLREQEEDQTVAQWLKKMEDELRENYLPDLGWIGELQPGKDPVEMSKAERHAVLNFWIDGMRAGYREEAERVGLDQPVREYYPGDPVSVVWAEETDKEDVEGVVVAVPSEVGGHYTIHTEDKTVFALSEDLTLNYHLKA